MLILLDDIPEEGLSLDLSEKAERLNSLATEDGAPKLEFDILAPVEAHLDITKTDDGLFVQGTMRALLGVGCARCLKVFEEEFNRRFSLYYSASSEEFDGAPDKELQRADMEVNQLDVNGLDTAGLILGQLSLEIPAKVLCSVDCKGLCHLCGADLNADGCGCKIEERPSRAFASLKNFKAKQPN
jgi:uncharacterized protein